MKVIPNFLRNSKDIIEYAEKHLIDKFAPREGKDKHESIIPGLCSRFKTLHSNDMTKDFIQLIFSDCDFDKFLQDYYSFIQIQRYEPDDFIIIHKDVYDIQKLHLVTLTTSNSDGLVVQDGTGLKKIYDIAGNYIDFPGYLYHFVGPVKNLRYSLVIGE